jgi:putative FmdB family regulatory protein
MPIYEYSCKKCGKTIEVIQKFSDPDLRKHEKCGGALTKLISASGFQFKGTGWYVTDYAKKSGGTATEAKESKESSTKTDSKAKESSPAAPAKSSSESGKKSSES